MSQLQNAKKWINQPKKLYINKAWVEPTGSDSITVENPATTEALCELRFASDADVNKAVQAAQDCFARGEWRNLNMRKKARIMRQMGELVREHTEELAMLESLPNGKTYQEALNDDLPDCADVFDYYAGWVDKHYGETVPVEAGFLNYTVNEPLGVCGLIVPWNFPLLMAMWKLAPALATGNTVVMKPSEYTSFTLLRLIEIFHEKLDLPAGLINVVLGGGNVGAQLSKHPKVNKVSFTGSTAVGKKIVENSGASNLKSVSLELGGKSPNIFFEDTPNLEAAIERSFHLIFSQKGEKCTEPTRFILHEKIHDEVVSGLVKRAETYKLGDPLDSSTNQGAQCNKAQFEKVLRYIEWGKADGAQLAFGGDLAEVPGFEKGYFVKPTIFTDVKPEHRIFQDEIFGPVLSISKFKTDEEAVALANNTTYGLAAGLWTSNITRAHKVAQAIDAGMIFINRYGCYEFSSPFGGFRQSGWGKEMGIHSLAAYTKKKNIWVAL